jgi:hypothetical protein
VSIKPIDLLTNVGQAPEVGRAQHAQAEALMEQLHHLDKESGDKAKTVDSRLDESREAEHATIRRDEERGQGRRRGRYRPKAQPQEQGKVVEFVENGNLGNIIDIRK